MAEIYSPSYWLDERFDLSTSNTHKETCLLCTSPRVGSHYLSSIMSASQDLGKPFEYFHKGHLAEWMKQTGTNSIDECISYIVRHRTTRGGLFSLKAHWSQYKWIKKTNSTIIDSLKINHYIYLTRKDILGQAISNTIAQQTGSFISLSGKSTKKPAYSAEQIKERIKFAIRITKQWESFFTTQKIQPLRIDYQDLQEDPSSMMHAIYNFIGITKTQAETDTLISDYKKQNDHKPQKQANQTNNEWRQRFLSEEEFVIPE